MIRQGMKIREGTPRDHLAPPMFFGLLAESYSWKNAENPKLKVKALVEEFDKKARTLGRKADALEKVGETLAAGFHGDLVDRRNNAVHEGTEVRYPQWESAFRAALELVERVYPLPTAPGSSEPLKRYWSRSTRPEIFGSEFSL